MLSEKQLNTMLDLQGKMNSRIDPNWIISGNCYLRAGMVEICEAISSHEDFKWWKKVETDLENIKTEIIDYIHFALSETIVYFSGDIQQASDIISTELTNDSSAIIFDGKKYDINALPPLELMDLMVGLSASRRVSWPLLVKIIDVFDMTADEVYKIYVGKNILNFFRQDHGYNTGKYIKIWNKHEQFEGEVFKEKEDNVYLHKAMSELDISSTSFPEKLYKELSKSYPG